VNILTEYIKILLQEELPGDKARSRMMPEIRGVNLTGKNLRKASVLILLYPGPKGLSLLLIKRTIDNGPHSAQISLPGGMHEEGDLNEEDTAIREASEETGISRSDVIVIGILSRLFIPVSNTEVIPVVGYLNYCPQLKPNPAEVEYVLEVALDDLLNPACIRCEIMQLSGRSINVPYFLLNGEKVWGATAMILAEFIDLAEKAVRDLQAPR
jgi:8-oxo-dGTP pyrophosphatase MutT (NUDIX family)